MKPEYIIQLQGRPCALYRGVLDLAHEIGLEGIRTKLLQPPDAANGDTAIVEAEVRMKDGRVFADIGDASPKNVNAKIATAIIRMASTRAKGRALRDAVNIGEALVEEMPDAEPDAGPQATDHRPSTPAAPRPAAPAHPAAAPAAPPAPPPPAAASGSYVCTEVGCGRALTQGQQTTSTREFGQGLCPACQRKRKAGNPPECSGARP
ncbi:MAG TPA: hypothetical protein DCQ64_24185 [Candidatus Rokubacteria bacterium]|nr:hypothetical protein [Candidatus Rokubacteria bacterium]